MKQLNIWAFSGKGSGQMTGQPLKGQAASLVGNVSQREINQKKKMSKLKITAFLLLLMILLAACGGGGDNVNGEITFQESGALPEDTTVTVQIQDTSLADAPATVIGEQVITDADQFPIPYSVSYDPDQIVENHTYTMSARITASDGSLLFINDTSIPVITQGNPTEDVEIPVIKVGG